MKFTRLPVWPLWLLGAVIAAVIYVFLGEGVSKVAIWPSLAVFYLSCYWITKRNVQIVGDIRSSVTPAILFIAGYYIIFYLPYQAFVVGSFWLDYSDMFNYAYVEQTNRAVVASTVGIMAFVSGATSVRMPISNGRVGGVRTRTKARFELLLIGAALTLVVAILVASGGIADLLSAGYSGSSVSNRTADGLYFMANMLSMMGIATAILSGVGSGRRSPVCLAVGLASMMWALILLVMGDRNGFFLIAITAASAFFTYVRSIRRITLAALIVLGILVYQGVEVTRQLQGRGILDVVEGIVEVGQADHHLDESSFNLSTIVTRAALESVPERHEYFRGRFKLIGMMGIIPYSRGLLPPLTDPFLTSADFLTFVVLGPTPSWSVGTTIVADLYLDFGIIGLLVLMFVIGWWAAFVCRRAQLERSTVGWGVLFAMTTGLFAELPRYSLDFPIRSIAWAACFYAFVFVIRKYGQQSSRRPKVSPNVE